MNRFFGSTTRSPGGSPCSPVESASYRTAAATRDELRASQSKPGTCTQIYRHCIERQRPDDDPISPKSRPRRRRPRRRRRLRRLLFATAAGPSASPAPAPPSSSPLSTGSGRASSTRPSDASRTAPTRRGSIPCRRRWIRGLSKRPRHTQTHRHAKSNQ